MSDYGGIKYDPEVVAAGAREIAKAGISAEDFLASYDPSALRAALEVELRSRTDQWIDEWAVGTGTGPKGILGE